MSGKIIVIEDDPLFREYLKVALQKITSKIKFFSEGKHALELLSSENPDLVITDLKLPDISGIEILAKVKEFNPAIQVIIITAYADMGNIIQSMQLNAYDIIKKPFDMERFLSSVKNVIQNGHLEDRQSININEERYNPEKEQMFLLSDSSSNIKSPFCFRPPHQI